MGQAEAVGVPLINKVGRMRRKSSPLAGSCRRNLARPRRWAAQKGWGSVGSNLAYAAHAPLSRTTRTPLFPSNYTHDVGPRTNPCRPLLHRYSPDRIVVFALRFSGPRDLAGCAIACKGGDLTRVLTDELAILVWRERGQS